MTKPPPGMSEEEEEPPGMTEEEEEPPPTSLWNHPMKPPPGVRAEVQCGGG
jgi:hypothetical protein